jgi:hypothetical protein
MEKSVSKRALGAAASLVLGLGQYPTRLAHEFGESAERD